jgi:hypothetical protein
MSIWIDRVTSTITPSVFHQSIHDQEHGSDWRQIERVTPVLELGEHRIDVRKGLFVRIYASEKNSNVNCRSL